MKLKSKPHQPKLQRGIGWLCIKAFVAGTAVCTALLALFALVLSRFDVSLNLVPLLACAAASTGSFAAGFLFAADFGKRRLLCGLGCGAFFGCCVLLGSLPGWQGSGVSELSFALPISLLCSGIAGGAAASLRPLH